MVEAGSEPLKIAQTRVLKARKANRAAQMNQGAAVAKGELLLFLHADTRIPTDSLLPLVQLMSRYKKCVGGAYRFALDQGGFKPKVVEWGVKCREWIFGLPYGDQAIFVRRATFEELGGYPLVPLLEDVLLVQALRKKGRLLYYRRSAVTSARKWERMGYWKMTRLNWETMVRRRLGTSIEDVAEWRHRELGLNKRGKHA